MASKKVARPHAADTRRGQDSRQLTVQEAGAMGGARTRELIEKGKSLEKRQR